MYLYSLISTCDFVDSLSILLKQYKQVIFNAQTKNKKRLLIFKHTNKRDQMFKYTSKRIDFRRLNIQAREL